MSPEARAIWKFPFRVEDSLILDMPAGAQILSVQAQREMPCIWALVDPAAAKERRWFRIFGAGHAVRQELGRFVGTFQLAGGALVFHVFEVEEPAS